MQLGKSELKKSKAIHEKLERQRQASAAVEKKYGVKAHL